MIPGMDPNVKEWLQALAWAGTAGGLIVAAWKLRSDAHATREQRDRDLRWRQAEAGKKLNDEMMTDVRSWAAMQMLDYSGRTFKLPSNTHCTITHSDLATALNASTTILKEKDIYIRDSFDGLFYYLATLEHYISSSLIRYEDVAFPIEYYVPLLGKFKTDAESYLKKYQLVRAQAFLSRFPAWESVKSP
jgi:hypothetical protein